MQAQDAFVEHSKSTAGKAADIVGKVMPAVELAMGMVPPPYDVAANAVVKVISFATSVFMYEKSCCK